MTVSPTAIIALPKPAASPICEPRARTWSTSSSRFNPASSSRPSPLSSIAWQHEQRGGGVVHAVPLTPSAAFASTEQVTQPPTRPRRRQLHRQAGQLPRHARSPPNPRHTVMANCVIIEQRSTHTGT